jgi:hypothetical protein
MRCIFLRKFVKYLMLGYKVLYIDESGFNIVNNKLKTWINHNANREVFMSSKTTNTTLIVACASDMIPYYKLIIGDTYGERFIDFFKCLYSQVE